MDANELANFLETHKVVGRLVVGDVTMDSIIDTIRNQQQKNEELWERLQWDYEKYMDLVSDYDSLRENLKWLWDKCSKIDFSDEEKEVLKKLQEQAKY